MKELHARVAGEVRKVVVGHAEALEDMLAGARARRSRAARGRARRGQDAARKRDGAGAGIDFRRLQFTPDMLPSDVTGTMTLRAGELVFRPGPVFAGVVLADEINRTPPKTQAALLEAMQEWQVTVDGDSARAPGPVPRARDPEPGRVRGHLSAARGPARPLPRARRDRLPRRTRSARCCGSRARASRRGARRTSAGGAPRTARRASRGRRDRGLRRGRRLRRRRHPAHARAAGVALGASPRAAVHLLARRRPPRGSRAASTSPRRRRAHGRPGAAPPPRAHARGRARARDGAPAQSAPRSRTSRCRDERPAGPSARLPAEGACRAGSPRACRAESPRAHRAASRPKRARGGGGQDFRSLSAVFLATPSLARAGERLGARGEAPRDDARSARRRRPRAARALGVGASGRRRGARRARTRRRRRGRRRRGPARTTVERRVPEVLSRGVPAELRIAAPAPAGGPCGCGRPRRGARRSSSARATVDCAARSSRCGAGGTCCPRSRRARPAARARALGPQRRRPRPNPRLPGPAHRAPAGAGRRPRALPRPGRDSPRPARPGDGVRADPRLRARRRHPPGQLARDGAAGAADEQSVPARAGPRPAAAARRRRLSAAPLDEDGTTVLDVCLDAAAALAFVADELGDRTGAVAFDDEVRTRSRLGARAASRWCARCSTSSRDRWTATTSSHSGAPRAPSARSWSSSATCSRRPPPARSSRAVPFLSRRHAVIVASPSDPTLAAIAAGGAAAGRGEAAPAKLDPLAPPRDDRSRRPCRPRPRQRTGARRRRARARGSARQACRRARRRLPAGQGARGPLTAAHAHQDQNRDEQREPERRLHGDRQLRPGREALEEAAQHEPRRRPRRHLDRGDRGSAQRRRAAQRSRPDQRPADPQPRDPADDDARDLQRPMRGDQPQERDPVARADRQPAIMPSISPLKNSARPSARRT